jgi:hypothetical protein
MTAPVKLRPEMDVPPAPAAAVAEIHVETMTVVWDGDRAPFAKAFIAAQKATESVKKAASNPAFKSKYADLSHVVEGVIPALNDADIGVMQFPAFDGEMVAVTTTFLHESGSSVTGTLKLRPSKSDPQGVGSAITYGRRYSLLAMTGTAPEDDDGNAASGPRRQDPPTQSSPPRQDATKTKGPTAPVTPTLAQRADRLEAALRAQKTEDDLRKAYSLASGLCAALDDKDPERLAEIDNLYQTLLDKLAAPPKDDFGIGEDEIPF